MALVLNNKVAGTVHDGTNSYCDSAYADDFWAFHFDTVRANAWNALNQPQKDAVLIQACKVLEQVRFTYSIIRTDWRFHRYYNRLTMQVMNFQLLREPVKWYFYQALQFPRNLDIDPISGSRFIPEPILMAQCEQAGYMLTFDDTVLSNQLQGVALDTVGVGRGQVQATQEYTGRGSMLAPRAIEYSRPFMVMGSKMRRA